MWKIKRERQWTELEFNIHNCVYKLYYLKTNSLPKITLIFLKDNKIKTLLYKSTFNKFGLIIWIQE